MRLGPAVVVLLIIAVVSVTSVNGYKKLVRLQRNVDSRWSDVDKQYQSRALLVPTLIQTLSAETNFDKAILTELAQAREKVDAIKLDPNQAPADADQFQQYVQAQQTLTKALSHVLMTTLKDPFLRTNKNLRTLEVEIIESGNRLAIVQNRFDKVVQIYNATVHNFPTAVEATVLGFKPRVSFQDQKAAAADK